MGKPSKAIQDMMATYKIASDEIWEVRSGGAWAVKHSALERVAAEQNITFELPHFAEKDAANKIVAMLVVARKGERMEWSIGEASPANNKNAYCYAMAEKRGKDRCILKLLNAHGHLYSEDEAEDFKRPNPHVTRPTDIVPDVEYDEHGHPVDNIPLGEDGIERLPKAKSREEFSALQSELRLNKTEADLLRWGDRSKNRIATLPVDWAATIRGLYAEHRDELRAARQAAE